MPQLQRIYHRGKHGENFYVVFDSTIWTWPRKSILPLLLRQNISFALSFTASRKNANISKTNNKMKNNYNDGEINVIEEVVSVVIPVVVVYAAVVVLCSVWSYNFVTASSLDPPSPPPQYFYHSLPRSLHAGKSKPSVGFPCNLTLQPSPPHQSSWTLFSSGVLAGVWWYRSLSRQETNDYILLQPAFQRRFHCWASSSAFWLRNSLHAGRSHSPRV